MKKFFKVLNKVLEIKVNALILLFASTVLVFAASKGTDGLWKFSSGDPVSSTQINQNFEAVAVPSGAVMAFNLDNCPTDKGWILADGSNGTPNLKGVFVRGLNLDADKDPGRIRGSYQKDEVIKHSHKWLYGQERDDEGNGTSSNEFTLTGGGFAEGGPIGYYGTADETRPKNVALLYCIKK